MPLLAFVENTSPSKASPRADAKAHEAVGRRLQPAQSAQRGLPVLPAQPASSETPASPKTPQPWPTSSPQAPCVSLS